MARVETYRSRGIPAPTSGEQAVPWPYLMGQSGRGQQQLGATIEQTAKGLLADYVDDKTAEELTNLDVNLIRAWGDYQSWTQTHLDSPDIEGAEFKRMAEGWKQQYLPELSTGISRQVGDRKWSLFLAQKGKQARANAADLQRTNAKAAFVSNVESLQQVPDRPFSLDDIHDHEEAIANAIDIAARNGLTPSDPDSILGNLRKACNKLWQNAILNAMKHSPQDVETLLADKGNFLAPDEEKSLRRTWQGEQNALQVAKERAYAAKQQANDRDVTALTLRTARGAAEPGQEITPATIEQAMLDGQISETTGRMLWDRLVKPRETDPATRLQSYGAMGRVTARLKRGEITPEYWQKVYNTHFQNLDEEDAEMFLDRAHTADPYDDLRSDAEKMAAEAMVPLFEEDVYVGEEGEPITVARDEAVGTVLRRLDAFVQGELAEGRTIDRTKYLDQARETIREVYREEYDRQNAPPPPPKPKRSRWTGQIRITTDEEYDQLDSGTEFIGPDGKLRRKP